MGITEESVLPKSISGLETKPEETTQNKEGETKWWKIKKKKGEKQTERIQ